MKTLEARTVGAALQLECSDNARDVINFNKRTNDHFQLRRREDEPGRGKRVGPGGEQLSSN